MIQPPWGLSPEVGGISTRVIKAEPFDACTRLTNKCSELEGAIVLVERGTCPFTTKAMIVSMSCPPRNTSAPGKWPFRCSDLASECEPRKAKQFSRDVKALMHEWCPKTCSAKTCGAPKRRREAPRRLQGNTTAAPTTEPPCTDNDEAVNKVSGGWAPNCAAAAHLCKNNDGVGQQARMHSPKSCRVCKTPAGSVPSGAPTRGHQWHAWATMQA